MAGFSSLFWAANRPQTTKLTREEIDSALFWSAIASNEETLVADWHVNNGIGALKCQASKVFGLSSHLKQLLVTHIVLSVHETKQFSVKSILIIVLSPLNSCSLCCHVATRRNAKLTALSLSKNALSESRLTLRSSDKFGSLIDNRWIDAS